MIELSVIVPVYNSEKYLRECIESILNQTFKDLELILVNDGSKDSSPQICDFYKEKDKRIKVIHKENEGVSVARNTGMGHAQGKYLTFVDSDDYIEQQMYEKMFKKIKKYDCDIVMCDCMKDFPDHSEIYTHNIRKGFYTKEQLEEEYYPQLLITKDMQYPATISNCLFVFKKELCEKNKIKYEKGIRFSEDWFFGSYLMLKANSFYYMKNQAFYHYRINNDSVTHVFVPDKWNDYCKLYKCMSNTFIKEKQYDFSEQLNKVLLFLLYNTIGDIYRTQSLTYGQKNKKIKDILKSDIIRKLFRKIKIEKLLISKKLKIITYLYKYQFGIKILIKYYMKN